MMYRDFLRNSINMLVVNFNFITFTHGLGVTWNGRFNIITLRHRFPCSSETRVFERNEISRHY